MNTKTTSFVAKKNMMFIFKYGLVLEGRVTSKNPQDGQSVALL